MPVCATIYDDPLNDRISYYNINFYTSNVQFNKFGLTLYYPVQCRIRTILEQF